MTDCSSDIYDYVAPRLAQFATPTSSPTRFPITTTHLILLLLPPTLFLPLLPSFMLPYLILPFGWTPPLLFHPNLNPWILSLPRHPVVLKYCALVERFLLTDSLSDDIGTKQIDTVEVWENERLDPALAAKQPTGTVAPGAWSSRHLRAGERAPWVKVVREGAKWKDEVKGDEKKEGDGRMVLALQDGWEYIPGEEWRVDSYGLWSENGADEGKWISYSRNADVRWVELQR